MREVRKLSDTNEPCGLAGGSGVSGICCGPHAEYEILKSVSLDENQRVRAYPATTVFACKCCHDRLVNAGLWIDVP